MLETNPQNTRRIGRPMETEGEEEAKEMRKLWRLNGGHG